MTAIERSHMVAEFVAMAERMGITLDELAAASASCPPENSKSVRDFLPAVEAATTDGAKLTYRPYWRLLVEELGERSVASIKTTDLLSLALEARAGPCVARTIEAGPPPERTASAPCVHSSG